MKEIIDNDQPENAPPPAPMITISPEMHAMCSVLLGLLVAGVGLWAGRNPAPNPPPVLSSYYHTPVYQAPPGQAWNTMCLWTGLFSS
ncbi:MAG: hypothetical protein ABIY70_00005, partial [Capsulimonas sp.]